MNPKLRLLASLTALSAVICLPAQSLAQAAAPASAPPPAATPHEQGAMHMDGRPHMHGRMQDRAQARAKAMHDVLNLRPDQEAAFQAYLAAMKPPEGREGMMGGRGRMEGMAGLTTPERLDRMAARMAERQAEFQRRADATKTFYAALSPEQQRAFDASHGQMGKRHHGRHGHPRHHEKE